MRSFLMREQKKRVTPGPTNKIATGKEMKGVTYPTWSVRKELGATEGTLLGRAVDYYDKQNWVRASITQHNKSKQEQRSHDVLAFR